MQNKTLVLICCILLSIPSIYATDFSEDNPVEGKMSLSVNTGNLRTSSSWIQPVINVNNPDYYAWTVIGPVYFTKASGKWPGSYWESGGLIPRVKKYTCPVYRSPYIVNGALGLAWAYINPSDPEGVNGRDIRIKKVSYGENNSDIVYFGEENKEFDIKFNLKQSTICTN